jgi:hypothetical protein
MECLVTMTTHVRPITSRRSSRAEGAARPRGRADHHYTVLATIEAAYTLPRDAEASTVAPIMDIWLP